MTSRGIVNPISSGRQQALEDLLPRVKGNLAWSHTQGNLRGLVRVSYYGELDDTGNGVNDVSP